MGTGRNARRRVAGYSYGDEMTEPAYITLSEPQPWSATFTGTDGEMLRIASDGFYVRGVKLEQDGNEARAVFDAMQAWLKDHGYGR